MSNTDLADALRAGMRRLASGVSVLSTEISGKRYAMTVSSVTSVSDSPASLLVCVNRETDIHDILLEGQGFVINVLSDRQQEESNICAQKGLAAERFSVGQWEHGVHNLPYLVNAQAAFFCTVAPETFSYNTHKIVLGTIDQVTTSTDPVAPLIYVDGGYWTR